MNGSSLPPLILENMSSLRKHHPDIPHRLFKLEELQSFLSDKFPREVFNAFMALKPYAFKADLARYCLMYEHGGVYADLSYCLLQPLPLDPQRVVVFRDFMWSSPWDTSNGLFSAPPKHGAFAQAIELICANVRRNYYGPTSLCPTGPALFGKALAMSCEAQDILTGSAELVEKNAVKEVAPDLDLPSDERSHCLTLENRLMAVKRKRMGSPGLTDFGVATDGGYYELWRAGDIYDLTKLGPATPKFIGSESLHSIGRKLRRWTRGRL